MNDYFDRIEARLVQNVEAGLPRRRRPMPRLDYPVGPRYLAPAFGAVVVLGVVAVLFGLRSSPSSSPQTAAGHTTTINYVGQPTAAAPDVTQASLERTAAAIRDRVHALAVTGVTITQVPNPAEISIRISGRSAAAAALLAAELTSTARLTFYDWEANVLLPDGKTAASQLLAQNIDAVTVSQGAGAPGGGGMSLYAAIKLASEQPFSHGGSTSIDWYYTFAKGGSAACAAAAKFYGVNPAGKGQHCLISGPSTSPTDSELGLPRSVTSALAKSPSSDGELLVVKPGTVVLQAVSPSFAHPAKVAAPTTRFYVLRDRAAVAGAGITHPTTSTDTGGNVAVTFDFSALGAKQFKSVTAAISRRGSEVSSAGATFNQHFAIALDGRLISVPQVDFKAYPDGIDASDGAEITGGFTRSSARVLATELRYGALPLSLLPVSTR